MASVSVSVRRNETLTFESLLEQRKSENHFQTKQLKTHQGIHHLLGRDKLHGLGLIALRETWESTNNTDDFHKFTAERYLLISYETAFLLHFIFTVKSAADNPGLVWQPTSHFLF